MFKSVELQQVSKHAVKIDINVNYFNKIDHPEKGNIIYCKQHRIRKKFFGKLP